MKFQSASDIEKHAADEIAKFLCEMSSSCIRISIFLDTKEIENIKKNFQLNKCSAEEGRDKKAR